MLDFDLAEMYATETKVLKQSVRRNIERFPEDFMFELTNDEYNELKMSLRSQFVTSNEYSRRGGIRYAPFAFTVHGVVMLPNVLQSKRAIDTSILIVRAFNAMANVLLNPPINEVKELQNEVRQLKQYIEEVFTDYNDINEDTQTQLDSINLQFSEIYQALIELADQKKELEKPRKPIGYLSSKE
jgi:phage regulator Rha-like protein